MSSQTEVVFTESNNANAFTMDSIFHMADYCRACLRIECALTSTVTEDSDSVKFCDKLSACVSEVVSGVDLTIKLCKSTSYNQKIFSRFFFVFILNNLKHLGCK